MLVDVTEEIRGHKRVCRVHARGMTQRVEDLSRAIHEQQWRLRERHRARDEPAIGHCDADHQESDRERQTRDGAAGIQRAYGPGGRHHLGRRCFTRRERGRERIAAGERRRDGERGRGTLRGIRLEASHDRAIDGRVEVAHDRRRLRHARLFAHRDQLSEVAPFEGAAAREELVEYEAERIEIAARGDFAARELLGRHISRCAGAQ
jgi:hypothetical protein